MQNGLFNPYGYAVELGAVKFIDGIHWTCVDFADEATRQKFDTECRKNDYRVRDLGEAKTQYYHYQD